MENHNTMNQDPVHSLKQQDVINRFNEVLERELSGYRFIGDILIPLTSPVEIEAIEEATATSATKGFDGAHEHLKAALILLGKKPEPDYRNY